MNSVEKKRSGKLRVELLDDTANSTSSVYVSNIPEKEGGKCLLIIDPQNDFVTGSLAVPGADKDCKNIATFIRKNIDQLQEVYVTLDTHMNYHIAHPLFWNEKPEPFTQITHDDIVQGKYSPVDPSMKKWVEDYTLTLENTARLPGVDAFTLIIWPPHCLVATEGNNVEPGIAAALKEWEEQNKRTVHYFLKGNNSKTEHYSGFRAEVIVEEDDNTKFNEKLFSNLDGHSHILVCGEAKSHCVNFSVRDMVQRMGDNVAKEKIILLEGGMSSVVGFESWGEKFWEDMKAKGLKSLNIEEEDPGCMGSVCPIM